MEMRRVILIVTLAVLVGCGAGSSTASIDATAATASLTITYWPNGADEEVKTTATLRCEPVGGTLARRADACRKLATFKNPFTPLRRDLMCTQQYGGPDQALISGTYRGRRVWVRLGLADGCQIARFNTLGFLVPGYTATRIGPGG